jgi:hypothetical protein
MIGGQRLHSADISGPPDQLLDRPAELARKVASESDRSVEKCHSYKKNEQPEAGVVVTVESINALKLANCGVELVCVIGQGPPFLRSQAGRIDRSEQCPARGSHFLNRASGTRRTRAGTYRQTPANDGQRRRQRTQADEGEQQPLMKGESHLF